jgi:outer membrane lipoprotein SlyB
MHTSTRFFSLAAAAALAAGLTACAVDPYGANNYPASQPYPVSQPAPPGSYPYGTYPAQQQGYVEYGRITNVSLVRPASGPTANNNTAGTLLGAVVGGALGNQIGHGGGRAAATILGAVGGAVVGNRVTGGGQPNYATTGAVYRVSVQTDSGQMRTYDVSSTGDLRPGDRVRIENGVIYQS